jgi:hypothetical protein
LKHPDTKTVQIVQYAGKVPGSLNRARTGHQKRRRAERRRYFSEPADGFRTDYQLGILKI